MSRLDIYNDPRNEIFKFNNNWFVAKKKEFNNSSELDSERNVIVREEILTMVEDENGNTTVPILEEKLISFVQFAYNSNIYLSAKEINTYNYISDFQSSKPFISKYILSKTRTNIFLQAPALFDEIELIKREYRKSLNAIHKEDGRILYNILFESCLKEERLSYPNTLEYIFRFNLVDACEYIVSKYKVFNTPLKEYYENGSNETEFNDAHQVLVALYKDKKKPPQCFFNFKSSRGTSEMYLIVKLLERVFNKSVKHPMILFRLSTTKPLKKNSFDKFKSQHKYDISKFYKSPFVRNLRQL